MIRALSLLLAATALAGCGQQWSTPPEEAATVDGAGEAGVKASGEEVATFGNGVKTVTSDAGVEATVARLEAALEAGGFGIVARLDHSSNAASVELDMSPAVSIFFGKPEVGTHLMRAAPSAALDLPQRMAVYQDAEGLTQVAYNSPLWLASRHGIEGQEQRLEAVAGALEQLAMAAAGKGPGSAQKEESDSW
ncbi:DUF302 domain-containing protein [Sphingomicrobium astaxanthinifaciens]|uniref:DUF302 domain-containing protein n=1 Tax=Sphingomicrobium astaxanthinifaciens TaxID=1227949 RepID=UPI001FCB9EE6|nr:DUF302 domain-containing protein [Sphingomicrobium astaxanthinifaciens]MCJ7422145.1 DUF302 domain-containing protein [Sphingomicrobium astaxanthinifaciens]